MKKILLAFLMLACAPKRETLHSYPESTSDPSWSFYEGRIPLDERSGLLIEVGLLPTVSPVEGEYLLKEKIDDGKYVHDVSGFSGTYTSFEQEGRILIRLNNSSLGDQVKRTFYAKNDKGKNTFREENLRAIDLTLERLDDDSFSVLGTTSEPVSADPNDFIYKRTSTYFTIEGYFRHTGDSADFLELNTERRWAISKMGVYGSAIRQYHELAQEKFEPVYLKGVGFTINRPNKKGKKVEALVINKLVQMSSIASTE